LNNFGILNNIKKKKKTLGRGSPVFLINLPTTLIPGHNINIAGQPTNLSDIRKIEILALNRPSPFITKKLIGQGFPFI
jgi:hypothetical protein